MQEKLYTKTHFEQQSHWSIENRWTVNVAIVTRPEAHRNALDGLAKPATIDSNEESKMKILQPQAWAHSWLFRAIHSIHFVSFAKHIRILTVFVSCAYSSYKSFISISSVRSRLRENVGVWNVAFSPLINFTSRNSRNAVASLNENGNFFTCFFQFIFQALLFLSHTNTHTRCTLTFAWIMNECEVKCKAILISRAKGKRFTKTIIAHCVFFSSVRWFRLFLSSLHHFAYFDSFTVHSTCTSHRILRHLPEILADWEGLVRMAAPFHRNTQIIYKRLLVWWPQQKHLLSTHCDVKENFERTKVSGGRNK